MNLINISNIHEGLLDLFESVLKDWMNEPGTGWHFGSGDPESWRFQKQLLVPNGKLLDLGIGGGRSSMFFLLNGMSVVGYDLNETKFEWLEDLKRALDLPLTIVQEDIENTDFGFWLYDTVLLTDLFIHFPSASAVYRVLDNAIRALKPGGHLSLRAVSIEDDSFNNMKGDISSFVVSENCIQAPCGCSGDLKMENHLFLPSTDLMLYLLKAGFKIVHSQLIPAVGRMNTMYGENWQHKPWHDEKKAYITLIAQKRR